MAVIRKKGQKKDRPTLTKEYKDEEIPCPLCGSEDYKTLHKKKLWDGGIYLITEDKYMFHKTDVMCMKCGLVFKNPMFTEESNDLFNRHDYTAIYHAGNIHGISHNEINESILSAAPFFEWIKKVGIDPNGKDVIDIGCGLGIFLYGLRELGANVTGVDPSQRNSKIAGKLFNMKLAEASLFDDIPETRKKYDIVMCMNSLEHFWSPQNVLIQMRGMVKDNGMIILELPALEKPYQSTTAEGFLSAAHLYTFSRWTITAMLNISGFRVTDIDFDGHMNCMYVVAVKDDNILTQEYRAREKIEAQFVELQATFKEALILQETTNKVMKALSEGRENDVEPLLESIPRSSNGIRILIGRQLIEMGHPDKSLNILKNWDFNQSESGVCNYSVFLTIQALCNLQMGDSLKGREILEEAREGFVPLFENNVFKNLYVDGVLGVAPFANCEYYRCVKLLEYLR